MFPTRSIFSEVVRVESRISIHHRPIENFIGVLVCPPNLFDIFALMATGKIRCADAPTEFLDMAHIVTKLYYSSSGESVHFIISCDQSQPRSDAERGSLNALFPTR